MAAASRTIRHDARAPVHEGRAVAPDAQARPRRTKAGSQARRSGAHAQVHLVTFTDRSRKEPHQAGSTLPDDGQATPSPVPGGTLSRQMLDDLFRCEQPRLSRALRRRVRNPEDVADLVQDAFAKLAAARPQGEVRSPAAYLQRIVRNMLIDRAKQVGRRLALADVRVGDLSPPVCPPQQSWDIEARELMRAYRAALDTLPTRAREVFLLHRVEELRYRDIAQRLGISVATVEYHMARALAQLDRALER